MMRGLQLFEEVYGVDHKDMHTTVRNIAVLAFNNGQFYVGI